MCATGHDFYTVRSRDWECVAEFVTLHVVRTLIHAHFTSILKTRDEWRLWKTRSEPMFIKGWEEFQPQSMMVDGRLGGSKSTYLNKLYWCPSSRRWWQDRSWSLPKNVDDLFFDLDTIGVTDRTIATAASIRAEYHHARAWSIRRCPWRPDERQPFAVGPWSMRGFRGSDGDYLDDEDRATFELKKWLHGAAKTRAEREAERAAIRKAIRRRQTRRDHRIAVNFLATLNNIKQLAEVIK